MPTKKRPFPRPCVVDTNVLIAANGPERCKHVTPIAVENSTKALLDISRNGGLVLDNDDRIFSEYLKQNKAGLLCLAGQPGVGDMFLRWVNDNRFNHTLCEQRSLNCRDEKTYVFDEFPADPALVAVDGPDKKFIAVANAGEPKLPILQFGDSKWWGWKDALMRIGIDVVFMDPDYAEATYLKKFTPK